VPAKTPKPIIDRLNAEFMKALKNPTVLEKLKLQSSVPLGSTPAEYGAYIEAETKRWAGVIKDTGVSLD
jgi:tripartite-type tricarboxylate transporter receptor subunit TctC